MEYVDAGYYKETYKGTAILDNLEQKLMFACSDIDTLTLNRIKAKGFEGLTEFQKEIVRRSVCLHADFTHQYGDMLNSPISGYSAGSTSVSFSKSNIHTQEGVVTSTRVMGYLGQTGLTTRLFI